MFSLLHCKLGLLRQCSMVVELQLDNNITLYGLTDSLMYVSLKDCHWNVANVSGLQSSILMQAASQRRDLA